MRLHPLNLFAAGVASALLAWAMWSLQGAAASVPQALGCFVFFFSTLCCAIGIDYADGRVGVSVRLTGWIFFVLGLVMHAVFALAGWSMTAYLITAGLCYLAFLVMANGVAGAAQS